MSPPPSSHCPGGGVLMARSDYKFWVQTEGSSVLTWPPHGSMASLWFELTWSSLPAWLAWEPSDLSGLEPGSPPLSFRLPLSVFGPLLMQSSLPRLTTWEPSDWADSAPEVLLGLPLTTAHAVQPPSLTIMRTMWSEWVNPDNLPGFHSISPEIPLELSFNYRLYLFYIVH